MILDRLDSEVQLSGAARGTSYPPPAAAPAEERLQRGFKCRSFRVLSSGKLAELSAAGGINRLNFSF